MKAMPYDNVIMISDGMGIYIPQSFVEQNFTIETEENEDGEDAIVRVEPTCGWLGADQDDLICVAKGPEEEWYWEAWDSILNSCRYIDNTGMVWNLYQDGDLWATPEIPCAVCPGWGEDPYLESIAETLALGRKARLEGLMERAHRLEVTAEQTLNTFYPDLTDDLMTVWELSLEDDPMQIQEWEDAANGKTSHSMA